MSLTGFDWVSVGFRRGFQISVIVGASLLSFMILIIIIFTIMMIFVVIHRDRLGAGRDDGRGEIESKGTFFFASSAVLHFSNEMNKKKGNPPFDRNPFSFLSFFFEGRGFDFIHLQPHSNRVLPIFPMISMINQVLPSFNGFYWVLPSFS